MSKDKKKKSKTVYYDDGRTIADMSGLSGGRSDREPGDNADFSFGKRATFKQKAQTYFAAVKTMIIPMLVVIGVLCVAFLILYILLELAS